jgi:ABC-2 type transport system permease protein
MSVIALTAVHSRYNLLETVRTPIALIGALVFPPLALLFFVVPQSAVAGDPVLATQAVASMCVFSVMVGSLFSFGITIAQERERSWDPYLRTLPAPGISRVLAQIFSTGLLALVSLIPLIIIGAVLTAAEVTVVELVLGLVAITITSLPFMLIGICIGYAFPSKAAIAVVQVLFFGLAFGGGMFLPPQIFPDWLNILSQFLPSRQARDIVIWAVQGGDLSLWNVVGIVAWTGILLALALALFRRDEGRRFR